MIRMHPASEGGLVPTDARSIHPATRLGPVCLTVADLARQLKFYQEALGLRLHWQNGSAAGLGSGSEDLLRLVECPGALRPGKTTGLYHFAIRVPGRADLARTIARLNDLRYPNYPTDHVMTQTTYLNDPEGNGIEVYVDTPEEGTWFFDETGFAARDSQGRLRSGRELLDLQRLFAHLPAHEPLDLPLPSATCLGHIHLHIADLGQAVDFHHHALGFDIMGKSEGMGMAFLSAGGYHHHIGFNTWLGKGVPAPPPDSLGLRYFSIVLPDDGALRKALRRLHAAGHVAIQTKQGALVRDPSQNCLLLCAQAEID